MAGTATQPTLAQVLDAVADPIRLEMLRRLAASTEPLRCGALYDELSRSTASYHFSKLREAGLIEQFGEHSGKLNTLCTEASEALYPGVLSSVLAAAPKL